jgi:hypothetical protein
MSADLYLVALRWSPGRGGYARLYDVRIPLPAEVPPRLAIAGPSGAPLDLEMVEYIPGLGVAHLRERHEAGRDMTRAEIQAADAYLRRVCDPAHSTPEARLP